MDPNSNTGGDRIPAGVAIFPPPRGYALSGKILLSAIVFLFVVVLVVLFLHLYVRWRFRRLASLRRRTRRLVSSPAPAGDGTYGLDPDVLRSLPVLVCTAGEGQEAVDCAVCLSEVEEGEKVRSLPRCGHRFHIECIDMWFHSHATCPLCRSAVEPMKIINPSISGVDSMPDVAAPPLPVLRHLDLIDSSPAGSSVPELRIEMPVRSGFEEDLGAGSPSGFKSPSGRIRAIRRLLSRDLRLCRVGEMDLEPGDVAERPPTGTLAPSPRTPPV